MSGELKTLAARFDDEVAELQTELDDTRDAFHRLQAIDAARMLDQERDFDRPLH
jgi:hypothetical protein